MRRGQLRKQSDLEARHSDELEAEARIRQRLQDWLKVLYLLGLLLAGSAASLVPFLYGHWLHRYWNIQGKAILVLAIGAFICFAFAAGTTYNFWSYLRDMRKVHKPK